MSEKTILVSELIRPPHRKVDWFSLCGCLFLLCMMAHCILDDNWFGAVIDFALVAVLGTYNVWHYLKAKRLWHEYETLVCVEKILTTPMMREEGYSLIFTFIAPSPHLMEAVMPIIESSTKGQQR